MSTVSINTHSLPLQPSHQPQDIAQQMQNLDDTYNSYWDEFEHIPRSEPADSLSFLKKFSSHRARCWTAYRESIQIQNTLNQALHTGIISPEKHEQNQETSRIIRKIDGLVVLLRTHLPYEIFKSVFYVCKIPGIEYLSPSLAEEQSLLAAACKIMAATPMLVLKCLEAEVDTIEPWMFDALFQNRRQALAMQNQETEQILDSCIDACINRDAPLTSTQLVPEEGEYLFHKAMQKKKARLATIGLLKIHDPKIQEALATTYTYQAIAQCLDTAWAMKAFVITSIQGLAVQVLRGIVPHIKEQSLRSALFMQTATVYARSDTTANVRFALHFIGSLILSGGIDVNYLNQYTNLFKEKISISPLLCAMCDFKDITMALMILSKRPNTLNKAQTAGHRYTALHVALSSMCLKNAEMQYHFVHALLEQGANPNIVDKDGNTSLHLAARLLDKNIIAIPALIKNTNMIQRNYSGSTALILLFRANDTQKAIECLEAIFPHCPTLLAEVRQSGLRSAYESFLKDPVGLARCSTNPFEIGFLLWGHRAIATIAHVLRMTQDTALQHVKEIAKKYPTSLSLSSVEQLLPLITYSTNVRHMKEFQDIVVPSKPEQSTIDDLYTLFDQMNFDNNNRPHYCNPASLFQDPTDTKQTLRECIDTCIQRVKTKAVYTGTPKETQPEALQEFYRTIEGAICHVIVALKTMDPENARPLIETFFIELIRASKECGGRTYTTLVNQFFMIVRNKKITPLDYFRRSLAELRQIILTDVNPAGPNSVHTYNRLVQEFGQEFGLPGYQHLTKNNFDDPFGNMEVGLIRGAKQRFLDGYRPSAIGEWIFDQLHASQDAREAFKEWAKEKIDTHEVNKIVTLMIKEAAVQGIASIRFLEPFSTQPRGIQEKIRAFFNERSIDFRPDTETMSMPKAAVEAYAVELLLKDFITVSAEDCTYSVNPKKIIELVTDLGRSTSN